jgi:hypothetical protein
MNSTGDFNTAFGDGALNGAVGDYNEAVGSYSGRGARWTNSMAVGHYAGRNATGTNRMYMDCYPVDPGASHVPTNDVWFLDNGALTLGRGGALAAGLTNQLRGTWVNSGAVATNDSRYLSSVTGTPWTAQGYLTSLGGLSNLTVTVSNGLTWIDAGASTGFVFRFSLPEGGTTNVYLP